MKDFTSGLLDALANLLGERDDKIKALQSQNTELPARLEELEDAVTLLRALKPARKEDA